MIYKILKLSSKTFFPSKHKKKSKSLSEVKSFSSFSFSDVALDYKGKALITKIDPKITIQ